MVEVKFFEPLLPQAFSALDFFFLCQEDFHFGEGCRSRAAPGRLQKQQTLSARQKFRSQHFSSKGAILSLIHACHHVRDVIFNLLSSD
jgi:hypothetical protein